MDEKTAPLKTDTPAPAAPSTEKPVTPAPDVAKEQPAAPVSSDKSASSSASVTPPAAPVKKTSPLVKILILLFILIDLALAGYIVYRMMM